MITWISLARQRRHESNRVESLALRQLRVQQADAAREAGQEASNGLRSEGDFGNQHDRGPALLEGQTDRLQVDFGLARSGDAVKQ